MAQRKSKLDDAKTVESIAQMLSLGLSLRDACLAVGMCYESARLWVNDAMQNGDERKLKFATIIASAKAKGKARHAANILKAAMGFEVVETRTTIKPDGSRTITTTNKQIVGDWRASQLFLERRDSGNWGQRSTLDVNVNWEDSLREHQIDPVQLADSMMEQITPLLEAGVAEDNE